MSSLNPVYTCGFQLTEAIRRHQNVSAALARRQAIASLQEVKLLPSDEELQQQYVGSSGLNNRKLQQLVNEQNKQCSTAIPTFWRAVAAGNDRHGNLL